MKAIDLLDVIGGAKDTYLLAALNSREQTSRRKRLSVNRIVLIAAIIALLLLLVGCTAAIVMRLDSLKLAEEQRTDGLTGETEVRSILSLQGFVGTPGYQASKEWYVWEQAYDPDMEIYHSDEAFSEDYGDEYWAYNLYSREMKEKVDEICAKYGLELLGRARVGDNIEDTFKALNISDIVKLDAAAETDWAGGYYYQNGSFYIEGYVTLTGTDNPWTHTELISFRCNRKDAFGDVYASIGPIGTYEEWVYTNSDGVDVLMVMEEDSALMMVDKGDYFFIVGGIETQLEGDSMDKEGLEAFADVFAFTILPQRISNTEMEAADERIAQANQQWKEEYDKKFAGYQEKCYDARIKFQMENTCHPDQLGFTLMDIDGNGEDELLVGENGYIRAVYMTIDGGTQHALMPDVVYNLVINNWIGVTPTNGPSYIYLCENNSLAYVCDGADGIIGYRFAQVENGQLVWKEEIRYDPVNYQNYSDSPWLRCDERPFNEPITEEEFNRILNSYTRVPITLYPISEFPLTDDSPSGIGMPDESYESYNALVQRLSEYSTDDCTFALVDLDDNLRDELVLFKGAWKGVFTMANGEVKLLECGENLTICQDHTIELVREYLDGNKTYSYYKVEDGQTVLVDYLRYDADANPENPWLRSCDASGQDVSMDAISEAEFYSILEKYLPLDPGMKPVSQFFLN